jgi:bifunctional non-homologous end joining protein LigD
MPLAVMQVPFDHPDWIFELKYDGWRALAYVDDGDCRVVSRNGNALKSFPVLCSGIGAAIRRRAVLDDKPAFFDLMRRRLLQHWFAFDLLWMDGRDLRRLPLLERKRLLRDLVQPPVVYVDHIVGAGVALFEEVCAGDLEGIVAKLSTGTYTPEETTWVKIKNRTYTQAEGRAEFFESGQ